MLLENANFKLANANLLLEMFLEKSKLLLEIVLDVKGGI
jgi:hypothetical protein